MTAQVLFYMFFQKKTHTLMLLSDKLMPEMHLKQPGFTYSTCGSFIRNKERIEKFMQIGNTDFIYRSDK